MLSEQSNIERRLNILEAAFMAHEKVCTERAGNINDKLVTIINTQTQHQTQNHERFNGLSARLWSIVFATTATSVVAVGVMAFFLMTGHK